MKADGSSYGVLLLNSNAMDVTLTRGSDDGKETSIGFQTTGGVLDLYFFAGPSPLRVVEQNRDLVGFPALPLYWGLGFHQSRWGYTSTNYTRGVVQSYIDAQVPLDTN